MTNRIELKAARDRTQKAFRAKPQIAQGTGVTRARVTNGYHCEVTEGPWTIEVDMPAAVGGTEKAPNPGMIGRSALASCLAIGIAGLAADRDIEIGTLSVEVQTDSDSRGWMLADSGVLPGFSQVRVVAEIDSSASDADLQALVRDATGLSPLVDTFRRANDVVTDVVLRRSAA